jgi:hypothetical protein
LKSLTFQVLPKQIPEQAKPICIRVVGMKRSIKVVKKKQDLPVKAVLVVPENMRLMSIRSWVEEFRERGPIAALPAFSSLFKEGTPAARRRGAAWPPAIPDDTKESE